MTQIEFLVLLFIFVVEFFLIIIAKRLDSINGYLKEITRIITFDKENKN